MNKVNHIAIIMDGNGRWGKQRGKSRNFGHQNGIKYESNYYILKWQKRQNHQISPE